MNCTLRACNCAAIGTTYLSGIPLDYCGAHERIARALPALRSPTATKCANSTCESAPVRTAIFCNTCRKRYHAWGVTQYPKETAMSEAVVPPADGGVAAHLSAIAKIEQDLRARRDAVAARMEAMGAAMYGYTYEIVYTVGFVRVTLPLNDKGIPVEDYARMVDAAERVLAGLEAAKAERPMTAAEVEAVVDRALPLGVPAGDAIAGSEAAKAEPDPAEPSAGDVADAQDGTPDGLVGLAAWEAGVAPLPKDDDIWPPAVMAAARAWAVATGEEADRLGRQIRSLCDSDIEVIAIKETARAEIADRRLAEAQAELKECSRLSECRRKEVERRGEALARGEKLLKKAEDERDRAQRERDEVVQLRAQRDEAEAKLSAIADLLNEDEERSPSFDADDKPIPLVDRVRVALMPDGFGQTATREADDLREKATKLTLALDDACAQWRETNAKLDKAERDAVAERAAREEAAEEAAKLRADLEEEQHRRVAAERAYAESGRCLAAARCAVAKLEAKELELSRQLSAIADLLNEDEERSPSFGADDKPIPLVDRVRVALMPDGFGQSEWERRLTRELDRCGAPEGFSPYLRTVLIAQALKEERERTKEQAQEIYDAGRVLTILGAPPHLPLREALMRVLSPEDRRAVLEVEAAEARAALVRVRALRVDPAAPGVVAEYEARAAAAQAALNEFPAGEEG